MAATTLLNAVSVAPRATSTYESLSLTAPVTGVQVQLSHSVSGTPGPSSGCRILYRLSVDGTTFSDPEPMSNLETAAYSQNPSVVVGFIDAQNCAAVKFAVHNKDDVNAATVTLVAIQV